MSANSTQRELPHSLILPASLTLHLIYTNLFVFFNHFFENATACLVLELQVLASVSELPAVTMSEFREVRGSFSLKLFDDDEPYIYFF